MQAVGEGVEVLAVVVGEAEGLADGGQELRLGAAAQPAVDVGEAEAGVLDGVLHVGDVEGAVPPVDAGLAGVRRPEPASPLIGAILSNES